MFKVCLEVNGTWVQFDSVNVHYNLQYFPKGKEEGGKGGGALGEIVVKEDVK